MFTYTETKREQSPQMGLTPQRTSRPTSLTASVLGTARHVATPMTVSEFLQRQLGNSLLAAFDGVPWRYRSDYCGGTYDGGHRAEQRSRVRPSLVVGAANDRYEQEAERVADQVARRTASEESATNISGRPLSLKASRPATARVTRSPGDPLTPAVRAFYEPRLQHDLGHVRTHTDNDAVALTMAVGARACTHGSHIYFDRSAYDLTTHGGRRLLAHELTHVVQQDRSGQQYMQRQIEGCRDLMEDPGAISLLSGRVVHRVISEHFMKNVAGATRVAIPGASAAPLRSQGLCGGDSKIIDPQIIGGASGAGYPDLVRITSGRVLQVAEIKPAAMVCLIDGEEQALRYIDQGNAQEPSQAAWRAALGVRVVSPLGPQQYDPPTLAVPGAVIWTAWCTPGLLAYTVRQLRRIRVTATERQRERHRLQRDAQPQLLVPAAAATTAAVAIAGRAVWRDFWRVVATRFAPRGAAAVGLAAADGPLPIGDLIAIGLTLLTIGQILTEWHELWSEADRIAAGT